MSSIRTDPLRGHRVIIAEERARRPDGWRGPVEAQDPAPCPFCPGQEAETPPEVLAFRPAGGRANDATWSVRVVPNRHPALRTEVREARAAVGLYDELSAVGAHEVFIESRAHVRSLDELGREPYAAVAHAWQERLVDLQRDVRLRQPVIFRDVGRAAGALLSHPHSQLVALPFVPRAIQDELRVLRAHHDAHERCLVCDVVRQEVESGERVVHENDAFVVLSPYAARVPFELWLVPRRCEARFERLGPEERAAFAEACFVAMRKLARALESPPVRFALRTAPFRGRGERDEGPYHWRAEIAPALVPASGFELASGAAINPVSPEAAAEFLRDTLTGA